MINPHLASRAWLLAIAAFAAGSVAVDAYAKRETQRVCILAHGEWKDDRCVVPAPTPESCTECRDVCAPKDKP